MENLKKYDNILITGASGKIASQILFELNRMGIKPIAHVRQSSDTKYIDSLGLEKRTADLRRQDEIAAIMEGVDAVIHTAGWVDFRGNRLTEFTGANTMGALYMYQSASRVGVKRFVHVSTVGALGALNRKIDGNKPDYHLGTEEMEYNLDRVKVPYLMTKRAAELELFKASKESKTDLVMVNPTIVASPQKNGDDKARFIKYFNKFIIPTTPVQINIVDLRDVAPGIISALEKGRDGEKYILGGDNIPIRELILSASTYLGKIPYLVRIPRKAYNMMSRFTSALAMGTGRSKITFYPDLVKLLDYNWTYSSKKAHDELGYRWRSIHVTLEDLLTNSMVGTYIKPEP